MKENDNDDMFDEIDPQKVENGYVVYEGKKGFSKTLYQKNDSPAKNEAIILLGQFGWECCRNEEKKEKQDLTFKKGNEILTIEVERRGERAWNTGVFRFPTAHIPNRKRYSSVKYFLSFSYDLRYCFRIKYENVRDETGVDIINTKNDVSREITTAESFIDIPVSKIDAFYVKTDGVWKEEDKTLWTVQPIVLELLDE